MILRGGTMTGNLTIQKATPHFVLDATGVTSGQITWRKDTVDYYKLFTSGASLNLFWYRYDDAGVNNGTIMNVTRATGEIGFGGNVQAGTPFTFRGFGADVDEVTMGIHNGIVAADSATSIKFFRASDSPTARIKSAREASTANGSLSFHTYVASTEGEVLRLASNKQATFFGPEPVVLPAGVNPTADDHAIRRAYFEAEAMARAFMRC